MGRNLSCVTALRPTELPIQRALGSLAGGNLKVDPLTSVLHPYSHYHEHLYDVYLHTRVTGQAMYL